VTPPLFVSHSLPEAVRFAVRSFTVTFNEAMSPLPASAVSILPPTAGAGVVTATAVTATDDPRTWRVEIPPTVVDGVFEVTVGRAVTDLAGNAMRRDVKFKFVQELPNLVVSRIVTPDEARPDQVVEVQWTVTNHGKGEAIGIWTDTVAVYDDDPRLAEEEEEETPADVLHSDREPPTAGVLHRALLVPGDSRRRQQSG
jgi:hypothetical protein